MTIDWEQNRANMLAAGFDEADVPRPDGTEVAVIAGAQRYTDTGNANRFVADHGHEVRYVGAWGRWLVWDGTRWERDTKGLAVELAKDTAGRLWGEVAQIIDSDDRKKAVRWAFQSENVNRLDAMLRLAQSDPAVAVDPEELDADPWDLNTPSGTVDLRTGELRPHDPGDLITKTTTVGYDPDAPAPRWTRFLAEVLPDSGLSAFVARFVGYAACAKTTEEAFGIAYGDGANGKTTLVNGVAQTLGDYAQTASTDILMAGRDQHPTGLADLQGARLVVAAETQEARKLNESLVKSITGRDRIKARFMRQDFFEFEPSHTVIMFTNHRPTITGSDLGIWRRLKLIPFTVTIAPEDQQHNLDDRLADEDAGILAWIVRGCLDWQAEGLNPPAIVEAATADYRAEQDTVGAFVEDRCVLGDDLIVSSVDLNRSYVDWCEEAGEEPKKIKAVGAILTERGFARRKWGQSRRWHWFGIGLEAQRVNP